jgi:hypothetical protein
LDQEFEKGSAVQFWFGISHSQNIEGLEQPGVGEVSLSVSLQVVSVNELASLSSQQGSPVKLTACLMAQMSRVSLTVGQDYQNFPLRIIFMVHHVCTLHLSK